MDTNYFICTLGQAALPGTSRPFENVNQLIDEQASKHSNLPAVGFYVSNGTDKTFTTRTITFKELYQGVLSVADIIEQGVDIPNKQTVGLLSNSSPAFLFTWLGLIRLGHPVLLIAPQCSASAVAHLSKACQASVLFHDEAHEKLAHAAVASSPDIDFLGMTAQPLPLEDDEEVLKLVCRKADNYTASSEVSRDEVAYLHHTSGTSTGVPKPIPQTHGGGVGVLPALDGSSAATFTTTPLYHGGVADSFRAWTSAALIWLFPSHHVPITAANINKCLEASSAAVQKSRVPQIRYFSSVPYILQMMAQDSAGMKHLQGMDLVGVGGAALPPEVGDDLVSKNVNLVSRYGSAECGFLMSSHRDYNKDKDWQYLRKSEHVDLLKFEKQEDGQSELVILSGWPHMAKKNREDGSFATSDLFAPHPSIPNAWRYHSRADSQLALVTGKKFDPAPLEGSLAASLPSISEVLIFGNGRPYPGALLFRSEAGRNASEDDVIGQIAPIVEKLNAESQSHARIPRNMLVPMPFEPTPLEKSSKGTVLRGAAEDKFREQIEAAYNRTTFDNEDISDDEVPNAISRIVQSVVGTSQHDHDPLTQDTDLFAYGVDSVACVQIRHALTQLLPKDSEPLPLTIVEDSGTMSRLSKTMLDLRRGEQTQSTEDKGQLLEQLVKEYSSFKTTNTPTSLTSESSTGYNILLTGPTGLLGTYILAQLLHHPQVKKIYLLVRGATTHAANERVTKALNSRMLSVPSNFESKVHVMSCKLSDPNLGLSESDYQLLTTEIDTIFHLAWSVNFLVSLRSLGTTHLAGLRNLLNLALASTRNPRFLFCSSVASVSSVAGTRQVPESIVEDISACGSTGYAQSKLAAELICLGAAKATRMRDRITVLRVGQLSGSTETGVWNASEAYPLMLASSGATGVLPDLHGEVLGWLPVDTAAASFLEAAFGKASTRGSVSGSGEANLEDVQRLRVLHLINTSTETTFTELSTCLRDAGEPITIVSVSEWLDRLEKLQDSDATKDHPALKLLAFWKQTYGRGSEPRKVQAGESGVSAAAKTDHVGDDSGGGYGYEMTVSRAAMPSLDRAIGPLTTEYMLKLWRWVKDNVR